MPRLKAMLAVAGLTSFTRRAATPKADYELEPIRRPLDESKADLQDEWLFDANHERKAHASALDGLASSLTRLRMAISEISTHAPITVEAEPAMPIGAMSFDSDLFDGEPMMFGSGTAEASPFDQLLFGESAPSVDFIPEARDVDIFRQAA